MNWISKFEHPKLWRFLIEEEVMRDITNQRDVTGYFLYISDSEGNDLYDYMQETLEVAQEQARDDFDVPMNSWARGE